VKHHRPTGLHCPACGKRKLITCDSRPTFGGIRRRKECNACGYRFSTVEKVTVSRETRRVPIVAGKPTTRISDPRNQQERG
jgi:transcriptional regulator NrdR family protein